MTGLQCGPGGRVPASGVDLRGHLERLANRAIYLEDIARFILGQK